MGQWSGELMPCPFLGALEVGQRGLLAPRRDPALRGRPCQAEARSNRRTHRGDLDPRREGVRSEDLLRLRTESPQKARQPPETQASQAVHDGLRAGSDELVLGVDRELENLSDLAFVDP